jgi:hypothetical protein
MLTLAGVASAAPARQKPPRQANPLIAPSPPTNVGRDVVFHSCGTGVWKRPGSGTSELADTARGATNVLETEPNNNAATANALPLGFGAGEFDTIDLSGTTSSTPATSFGTLAEDNDSISTATDLGLTPGVSAALLATGNVGNGAFGATTGDVDFVAIAAQAGQILTIDISTAGLGSDLDSVVGLFDAAGTLVAFNDDDPREFTLDSYIEFTVPADGTYYGAIVGWNGFGPDANLPSDPFTAGTGTGAASLGDYSVTIGLGAGDIDFFSAELRRGDIIGMAGAGVQKLQLIAPDGVSLIHGSGQNASGIYPSSSPLPGGGSHALSYVIPADGTYFMTLGANANGTYSVVASLFRPNFEQQAELNHQYLFLDFDGVTGLAADQIWGGNANATLSPMSVFLAGWGLAPGDEPALIDAISARVQAIMDDIATNGNNGALTIGDGTPGSFKVTVLNSKDHPDPFGQTNVSRLIIGGTISQLGLSTIGIAESIDVGNFAHEESAVILLDLLSGPSSDGNSLNQYGVGGGATKIDLIAAGVGNITAHEAAHFLGCWHTDQFNDTPCIIDQGGNLDNTVGVGADRVFGTADDRDVLNVIDVYNPNEGFSGSQDTRNAIAFGASSGTTPGLWRDIVDDGYHWSGRREAADTFAVEIDSIVPGVLGTLNGVAAPSISGSGYGVFFYGHGGDDVVAFDGVPDRAMSVMVYGDTPGTTLAGTDSLSVVNLTVDSGTATLPDGSVTFVEASGATFSYFGFESVSLPIEISGVSGIAVR